MKRAFVQISKAGDIFSVIPILYAEYQRTGQIQNLVVSERFSPLLNGFSYINPAIFNGHWSDLKGAIKWAKSQFDEVLVLQTHGKDFPFQHKTPSFQIESYLRAGYVDRWDELPLVVDNRNKQREYALTSRIIGRKKKPFILIGDSSESSPFEFVAELIEMLEKGFPNHRIVKLSEVKAEYVFDLLGLYDKADLLVTTETVHSHLSTASEVPTIVLAANGWRGTACSKKFKFYCRYSEWQHRKHRLISEAQAVVAGIEPPKMRPVETLHKSGYNLSLVDFKGNKVGVYRYHNGSWKTQLSIIVGGECFHLHCAPSVSEFSIEDCRAFVFKGKLHGAYTVSMAHAGFFKCYMAYGEITEKDGIWSIGHIHILRQGNDFTGLEKNWCPMVIADKLYFLYGIKGENQITLEVHGDKVQAEHQSPAPKWNNGQIRGGCVIPQGDKLLRFFHSRTDYPDKNFRYFTGVAVMESRPPFNTIKVCRGAILSGNEIYTPNCPQWKRNCCLPYGVIKDGDKFLLSVGLNDCKSAVVELSEYQLKL
jgi:hypothetical protein